MKTYEYYINLDERGEFYSDVRDENDNTVLEIRDAEEFYEDGFGNARNVRDIEDYMIFMGMMTSADSLVEGN